MSEQRERLADNQPTSGQKQEGFFDWAKGVVGKAYDAAQQGALGVAFNQGRDEAAQALKAFPDAVHASNFQQTDHAPSPADGGVHGKQEAEPDKPHRRPSPSEIARGLVQPESKQADRQVHGQQQDQERERGRDR